MKYIFFVKLNKHLLFFAIFYKGQMLELFAYVTLDLVRYLMDLIINGVQEKQPVNLIDLSS